MSTALACDVCQVVTHPNRLHTRTDVEKQYGWLPSRLDARLPEQIHVSPARSNRLIRGWLRVQLSLHDEVQHICDPCYAEMVAELLRAGAEAFTARYASALESQTQAAPQAERQAS